MFFCGADQRLIVEGKARVVGMADDADFGKLHRAEVSGGVLRGGSRLVAGAVDAGNGVVQFIHDIRRKIHMTLVVHDVQLGSEHHLHAEEIAGNMLEISEIVRRNADGNAGRVVSDT